MPERSWPATVPLRPLSLLGEGALGRVWRAAPEGDGPDVALKVLRAGRAAEGWRLKAEHRALAALDHPGFPRAVGLWEEGGRAAVAMERIEGPELSAALRAAIPAEGPLGPAGRAALRGRLRAALEALDALHGAGWVHRDLKPEHLREADGGRVVLLDLDLAAPLRAGAWDAGAGRVVGSAPWCAPEQARGAAAAPAADVYALGVVLLSAIAGCPPPRRPPPDGGWRLDALRPELEPEIVELIANLTRADPAARPEVRARLGALGRPAPRPHAPAAGPPGGAPWTPPSPGHPRRYPPSVGGPLADALELGLAQDPHALMLRGRCDPREHVQHRGLDAAMDRLARALRCLPAAQARALLPPDLAPLLQAFPGLRSIGAAAELAGAWTAPMPEAADRLLAAWTGLLQRCARRWRITLWLDDVHLAAPETRALIDGLWQVPDLPFCFGRTEALVRPKAGEGAGAGPRLLC